MSDRRSVTILGSTGSVGCNTVSLLAAAPDRFEVVALAAHRNVELLAEQARALRPRFVAIGDPGGYRALSEALAGRDIEIAAGAEAVVEAARRPAEWVMASIVGAAGLAPTLAAVERGAIVALANKECLVCAGDLLMAAARRHGATLLPVDSEHNAIFQVFDFKEPATVDHIVLTASGGPFRTWPREDMARATAAQAVAHPNWRMGAKISIDSATMMNKGLELIEAHHLFGMAEERIEIVVHPQSIVHSLVVYRDGSVLAQLGTPDMRIPISVTLAWPSRMPVDDARLDLTRLAGLTFEAPDENRFPALRLARAALKTGGAAPTILNAANEVAVQAFLEGRIGFLDIVDVVGRTLDAADLATPCDLDDVRACDQVARQTAAGFIAAAG